MKSLSIVFVAVVVVVNMISFFAPAGQAAMDDATNRIHNNIEMNISK